MQRFSAGNAVRLEYKLPVDLLAEFLSFGFQPRDVRKHWKQHCWISNAPLQMHKLKALSAACFSADVTSLVTADLDHPTISDQGWLRLARSRVDMALDDADTRLCLGCFLPIDRVGDHAMCCSKLVLYARDNDLRDEFAALCFGGRAGERLGHSVPSGHVYVHGVDNSSLAVDFPAVHP